MKLFFSAEQQLKLKMVSDGDCWRFSFHKGRTRRRRFWVGVNMFNKENSVCVIDETISGLFIRGSASILSANQQIIY